MGNFKVSFTTALFVFSFIICVIVAVVFVDRSPRSDDYDSFYDKDKQSSAPGSNTAPAEDTWNRRQDATPAASPTAPPDSALAELPIDQNLLNASVPLPTAGYAATPMPTANPMQGRTPDEIARMLRQQSTGLAPLPTAAPALAVPDGIATPPPAAAAQPAPFKATPYTVQSNLPSQGSAAPASQQAPGFSTSNMGGNTWPSVSGATPTPPTMKGFRSQPSNNAGMMISTGKTATDATPPPGFDAESGITREPPATPFSAAPGGAGNVNGFGSTTLQPPPSLSTGPTGAAPTPSTGQLLYAPGSPPGSNNRSALPPAPTLPPPPIVDPDRPRSDAGDPGEALTPGSENPEGFSGQALAISAPAADTAETADAATEPAAQPAADEKIAALVNDIELTQNHAEKLATAQALLTKKPLSQETRKQQVDEVVKNWTAITAAAEQARLNELPLAESDFDRYAAMRPDLDVDAWKKTLKEAGFSDMEVKQRVAEVALSEKLVENAVTEKYPDKELKKLYDKNPRQYASPRQVKVLEIYKAKPKDADELKKVSGQMKRLQIQAAQGTDFALLANQASEAASKTKGGERGWVTPADEKEKPLSAALKTLKPGAVSEVIETDDGYRIVKAIEEKPAREDFEGCKDEILDKLKTDLREPTLADAKKTQNVVLSPSGRMISARQEKKASEEPKVASAKKSGRKEPKGTSAAAPSTDIADATKPAAAAAQAAAAPPTPATQTLDGQKEYVASAQPATQELAGGQPQPAQPAGGQTPVPTQNMGLTPGATIMVGGNGQANPMNPANSTTVSYPPGTTVQSNSAADTANADLMREAQAMQAQAQAQQQAKNRAVELELQRARGTAGVEGDSAQPGQSAMLPGALAQQPGDGVDQPGEVGHAQTESGVSMSASVRPRGSNNLGALQDATGAQPGPLGAQAANFNMQAMNAQAMQMGATDPAAGDLPPLQATPDISQSNGWTVAKQVNDDATNRRAPRNNQRNRQAAPGENTMNVPGFGGTPVNDTAQPQQASNNEDKPGIAGKVKSFFKKL